MSQAITELTGCLFVYGSFVVLKCCAGFPVDISVVILPFFSKLQLFFLIRQIMVCSRLDIFGEVSHFPRPARCACWRRRRLFPPLRFGSLRRPRLWSSIPLVDLLTPLLTEPLKLLFGVGRRRFHRGLLLLSCCNLKSRKSILTYPERTEVFRHH